MDILCICCEELSVIIQIVLAVIGIVVGFYGIKLARSVKEDIAFNQTKMKEVEAVAELVRYINMHMINVDVKGVDGNSEISYDSRLKLNCNLFELATLTNRKYASIIKIAPNTNIFLSEESYSILYARDFSTNANIPHSIAIQLRKMECDNIMPYDSKKELNCQEVIVLKTREKTEEEFSRDIQMSALVNYVPIQYREISGKYVMTWGNLLKTANSLKTSIITWYKNNGVSDYNLCIDMDKVVISKTEK